jgi:hypothetical protein
MACEELVRARAIASHKYTRLRPVNRLKERKASWNGSGLTMTVENVE